jgi:hypothetical protein
MIIERVPAENVLKYVGLDLEQIPPRGLIAMIGGNESGKSNIGESFCFGLFGRTFSPGPGELDKIIRLGESRCAIKLDFRTPDGNRYQVARFLDALGSHGASISRPGEQPLVRGVEAVAERASKDLIGFGYPELTESFYLAQREISTPKPHSDAVKAMAGIDVLERVAADCRRERDQESEIHMEENEQLGGLEDILHTEAILVLGEVRDPSVAERAQTLVTGRLGDLVDSERLRELQQELKGILRGLVEELPGPQGAGRPDRRCPARGRGGAPRGDRDWTGAHRRGPGTGPPPSGAPRHPQGAQGQAGRTRLDRRMEVRQLGGGPARRGHPQHLPALQHRGPQPLR